MSFSIATWNINSVRLRQGLVEGFLNEHQPDVLCLQEIKCQNDQFPYKTFRNIGYEYIAVNGQKGYHGVATLSKHPIIEQQITDYCEKGDTRHLATTHEMAGKAFRLHNFYVPAGGDVADPEVNEKFAHKLQFIEEMRALKAQDGETPQVLVGDLNIAPLEHDVWSHKQLLKVVSHTPVETDAMKQLMEEGGWVDLIRKNIPDEEKVYTWWSYRARDWDASNKGRRLDHIWSAPELADKFEKIEILRHARGWEKPSDHVPVIARFK